MVEKKTEMKKDKEKKHSEKAGENKKDSAVTNEEKKKSGRRRKNKKSTGKKEAGRREDNKREDKIRPENKKTEGSRQENKRRRDNRREDGPRSENKKEENTRFENRRESVRRERRREASRKAGLQNQAVKDQEVKNELLMLTDQGSKTELLIVEQVKVDSARTKTTGSARTAETARTTDSAKTTDFAKAAEAAEGADSAKIAESAEGADSAKTAEAAKATDSAKKAEAAKATDSAKNAESAKAIDSTKNAESAKATDSAKSADSPKAADGKEEAAGPGEKESRGKGKELKEKDEGPKVKVIGVRFRDNGKIYYFSAGNLAVKNGDNVIVETARGIEYGRVVFGNREVEEKRIVSTLKPVIRIATEKDDQTHEDNIIKSKEAYVICQEKIRQRGLDMKLIDCEYTFDNNKVLFYFTADGRIDFRELVKDLAAVFKTRIELRQIGVRDETKIKGGIGICGRSLCCNTFLSEFIPVSIKMAKEQNLSLNPTKISGVCGRLMCCLKNEQDTYEYLNKKLPNPGDEVKMSDGNKGTVQSVNVLRQKVKVIITDERDSKELVEYDAKDLTFQSKRRKERVKVDAELKKLEAMERKERKSKL